MDLQLDIFGDPILEAKSYEEFRTLLGGSGCTRCALSEERNSIVVDRGRPTADILAIGEAPGADEDLQGRAFVGRAGQLLDKIMASIGLSTEDDLLIANIVKCRPPGNRPPKAPEVQSCLPFLHRQIALVRPRVILLLGATALKHLFPDKKQFSMAEEAGRFFTDERFPRIQFMVLYHPAFLLRDSRKKKDMWEHVKRLRDYLEEESLLPA